MRKSAIAAAVTALVAAGAAAGARAGSAPSAAAQMCLQGPQIDHYQIVNETDSSPSLDFAGLAHGSDSIGPYVIAPNHGGCVSFVAENSKAKGKGKAAEPTEYLTITFSQVFISQ